MFILILVDYDIFSVDRKMILDPTFAYKLNFNFAQMKFEMITHTEYSCIISTKTKQA